MTWQQAGKLGDLRECWPFIIEIKARYISLTKKYLNKTKKTRTIMAPMTSDVLFGPFFLTWQRARDTSQMRLEPRAQMMELRFVVCALLSAPGHRRCGVSGDGSCTHIPLVKKKH